MATLKYSNFNESKIWENLSTNTDATTLGKINEILNKVIPLLKETKRVFPTYTNHDSEHSLKIIETIEVLLGDNIKKLSVSESVVILLSSFWHDLGMICNNPEEIKKEEWFEPFIQNQVGYNGKLTDQIASNYIRIYHHLRLEKYLFDSNIILADNEKCLFIDGNDIINISFHVAMSHNYETKELEKFSEFSSNLNKDDFVLCAILLRIADIIDFDNERTPDSSFKFLGLENPSNSDEAFSQKEWKKHLNSLGFEYQDNILYFKAIPREPDTEFYIREFIKVIEHEIEKSNKVFNACCIKWRNDFALPNNEIDTSGIQAQNYKFGDYKFSFDNNQVLDLLTGNNIYTNKMIFIRELLQNSIDASLYLEALEKEKGNFDFKCNAINITDWYDDNGNYWLRFDDNGIGMDEYVLLNYFTKIGKSFYESYDFNKNVDFKAISRFGIGILSCFMVAQKIEVSTKKENCEAIRFSIKSLYSYFTTQLESKHRNVSYFPSHKNNEKHKYRRESGTSIALQIDFNKLDNWFDIKDELLKHIFYTPIDIEYKNEKIGTTLNDFNMNPWLEKEIVFSLNDKDCKDLRSFLDISDHEKDIQIKVTPINLSSYSLSNKVKIQMIIIKVINHSGYYRCFPISRDNYSIEIQIKKNLLKNKSLSLHLIKKFDKRDLREVRETIDLENYEELKIFNFYNSSKLGHNGILITEDFSNSHNTELLSFSEKSIFSIAHIYLSDELRPSLDISRSKEVDFCHKTISTVNLMLSKYITENNLINETYDCSILRNRYNGTVQYNEILQDNNIDEWKNEKIFLIKNPEKVNKFCSLNEIQTILKEKSIVKVLNYPSINHFYIDYINKPHTRGIFILILSQLYTNGYIDENSHYNIERVYDDKQIITNKKYFQVGFFAKYKDDIKHELHFNETDRDNNPLNEEHVFSIWIIKNAKILNNKYKGIFEDIKNIFIYKNRNNVNRFERLKYLVQLLQRLDSNLVEDSVINSIK